MPARAAFTAAARAPATCQSGDGRTDDAARPLAVNAGHWERQNLRIKRREDEVQAWTYLDEARALDEARSRDRSPNRGPLFGIPVGVKDIINTVDMPSEYGSPIYRGHRPCADAACVALLRAAGAAVLGKTITTEFATTYRGKTRNPHALNRTPGGSFVSIRRSF
jgi:Asp-tRNA(Asn)/Glu-tRNA(Gln) amidotransferase A subunit family amidase